MGVDNPTSSAKPAPQLKNVNLDFQSTVHDQGQTEGSTTLFKAEIFEELDRLDWSACYPAIEDRVLVLTSQQQKCESDIIIDAILKHEDVKEITRKASLTLECVNSALDALQSARHDVQKIKDHLTICDLEIADLSSKQDSVQVALDFCSSLKCLDQWENKFQKLIEAKKHKQAIEFLKASTEAIQNERAAKLVLEVPVLAKTQTKMTSEWYRMHTILLDCWGDEVRHCLGSKRFQSDRLLSWLDLIQQCPSMPTTAGSHVMYMFTEHLPSLIEKYLHASSDKGNLAAELAESSSTSSLVKRMSARRSIDVVRRLLKLFWDLFLIYYHLRVWAGHELSSGRLSTPMQEYLAKMITDIDGGWPGYHAVLTVILMDLLGDLDLPSILPMEFVLIVAQVLRFCLELDCLLDQYQREFIAGKSSLRQDARKNDDNPCVADDVHVPSAHYATADVPYVWGLASQKGILGRLETLTELYLAQLSTRNLTQLRDYISTDTWQRLPTSTPSTDSLLAELFPHEISIEKYLFWDHYNADFCKNFPQYKTVPAWNRPDNPFMYAVSVRDMQSAHWEAQTSTSRDKMLFSDVKAGHEGILSLSDKKSSFSNKGPILSMSSYRFLQILKGYIELRLVVPSLHFHILFAALSCIKLIVYASLFLFASKEQLKLLTTEAKLPPTCCGGSILYQRHEAFLLKNQVPLVAPILKFFRALKDATFKAAMTQDVVNVSESWTLPFPDKKVLVGLLQCNLQQLFDVLDGLQITPDDRLVSPGHCWALAEKVTCLESSRTCLYILRHTLISPIDNLKVLQIALDKNWASHLDNVVSELDRTIVHLRTLLYSRSAKDLLKLDRLEATISAYEWDQAQPSSIKPSIDQLRFQLHDLKRKIACCGGGSIPQRIQKLLWEFIAVHATEACVRGLAHNTKPFKMTDERLPIALCNLAGELRHFLLDIATCLVKCESDSLPIDADLETILNLSYLNTYINAHALRGSALVNWCKTQNAVYHITLQTQLIKKLEPLPGPCKAYISELELHCANYLRGKDPFEDRPQAS